MRRIGRYRVTLNGFSVISETWDHVLEVDGKRDEVFIVFRTDIVRSEAIVASFGTFTSPIMGDTNDPFGYRVRAGSAWGGKGGLQTGDHFPTNTPWRVTTPLSNVPPMVLWEGELADEGDEVLITPTIWEWDHTSGAPGNEALEALSKLTGAAATALVSVPEASIPLGVAHAVLHAIAGVDFGVAGSRPIGFAERDGSGPVEGLRLNLGAAQRLLESATLYGPGVVGIRYKDPGNLNGDYQLYLQIHQLVAPRDILDESTTASEVVGPSATIEISPAGPAATVAVPEYDVGAPTLTEVIQYCAANGLPIPSRDVPNVAIRPFPADVQEMIGLTGIQTTVQYRYVKNWSIRAVADVKNGAVPLLTGNLAFQWSLAGTEISATPTLEHNVTPVRVVDRRTLSVLVSSGGEKSARNAIRVELGRIHRIVNVDGPSLERLARILDPQRLQFLRRRGYLA